MNINHEWPAVSIWIGHTDWKTKARELRAVWAVLLWADGDTEREVHDKHEAMRDIELLIEVAWQHHYTDRALAA